MNKVIKLLLKCALVSLPIWGLSIYLATATKQYSNEEVAYLTWNREQTSKKQDKYYSVIAIGDSACNACYMPEVMSDSMINLSVLGISPVEGYYILEDYLYNNEAPTDVFMTYNDTHFHYMELFWDEVVASHRFDLVTNFKIIKDAGSEVTEGRGTVGSIADLVAYETYFPSKYMASFMNSWEEDRASINESAYSKISLHKGRYTCVGNEEFITGRFRDYDGFYAKDIYVDYLDKAIKLCQDRGINVHLIKAPLPDNSNMSEEYINQINDFYGSFVDRYDNVTYDWPVQMYSGADFWDEVHLNNDGAYKFSCLIRNHFPEVFGDIDYTASMMDAIDDTIAMEIEAEDIFGYTKDRDYTLLLYDGRDCIDDCRGSLASVNNMKIYPMDDQGLPDNYESLMYYCYSDAAHVPDIEVTANDMGAYVSVDGGEQSMWQFHERAGIVAVVIDNVNKRIVTVKNIEYLGAEGFARYIF